MTVIRLAPRRSGDPLRAEALGKLRSLGEGRGDAGAPWQQIQTGVAACAGLAVAAWAASNSADYFSVAAAAVVGAGIGTVGALRKWFSGGMISLDSRAQLLVGDTLETTGRLVRAVHQRCIDQLRRFNVD